MFHKSARQKSLRFHKTSAGVQKQALLWFHAVASCRTRGAADTRALRASRWPLACSAALRIFSLRSLRGRPTSAAKARVLHM